MSQEISIEDKTTDQLLKEHVNLQNVLKNKGVTQQEINALCEIERELTIREELP